jgi:hypothetical protein
LCERTGYFGIFEAEFVRADDQLQLIDFNPRFYGQMGFDVARGLPLPYLMWLGALGRDAEVTAAVEQAQQWTTGRGYVYCNRFFLNLTLFWQGMSGRMSREERSRWRHWLDVASSRELAFDPMESPSDPLPGWVSKVRELYAAARHPRAFYRKVIVGGAMFAFHGGELLNHLG